MRRGKPAEVEGALRVAHLLAALEPPLGRCEVARDAVPVRVRLAEGPDARDVVKHRAPRKPRCRTSRVGARAFAGLESEANVVHRAHVAADHRGERGPREGGLVVDRQPVRAVVEGAAEVVHGEGVALRGAPLEQLALEALVRVLVHVARRLAAEGAVREGLRDSVDALEDVRLVAFVAHDLAAAQGDGRRAAARPLGRGAQRVGQPRVHADRARHEGLLLRREVGVAHGHRLLASAPVETHLVPLALGREADRRAALPVELGAARQPVHAHARADERVPRRRLLGGREDLLEHQLDAARLRGARRHRVAQRVDGARVAAQPHLGQGLLVAQAAAHEQIVHRLDALRVAPRLVPAPPDHAHRTDAEVLVDRNQTRAARVELHAVRQQRPGGRLGPNLTHDARLPAASGPAVALDACPDGKARRRRTRCDGRSADASLVVLAHRRHILHAVGRGVAMHLDRVGAVDSTTPVVLGISELVDPGRHPAPASDVEETDDLDALRRARIRVAADLDLHAIAHLEAGRLILTRRQHRGRRPLRRRAGAAASALLLFLESTNHHVVVVRRKDEPVALVEPNLVGHTFPPAEVWLCVEVSDDGPGLPCAAVALHACADGET